MKRLLILIGAVLAVQQAGDPAGANKDSGNPPAAARSSAPAANEPPPATNPPPDDPRTSYNKACASAAEGKSDEAEQLFERARLGGDEPVVAASHYNLGCLAAERAKSKLGAEPADAAPEVRRASIDLLTQAVASYRACLAIAPEHQHARHNLEVLRLWMKQMEDVWRRRDREKQRDSLGLLEFLEWIQGQQQQLRRESQAIAKAEDSPRRRQAATEISNSQRELTGEIPPLQEKIRQSLTAPSPGAPGAAAASPDPDPAVVQAVEALEREAEAAKHEMSRATVDLATNSPLSAIVPQGKVLDRLDNIYRAVAPFEHLLRKAIAAQETLIGVSRTVINSPDQLSEDVDANELAGDQRRVAGWADTLRAKAEQQLRNLESQPPDTSPAVGPPPAAPPAVSPPAPVAKDAVDPRAVSAEEAVEKQRSGLRKAVELAPQAAVAAAEAATGLAEKQWQVALPKQEQALKLLKEILESQPRAEQPPPSSKQSSPENKSPNDQKSDQEQDKQKSPDRSDQADSKDKDQQKSGKKPDQQDQQKPGREESTGGDQQQEQTQPEQSPQRAEALLRQVRQRERDYKEQQKKIKALLRGSVKVDKDW